MLVVAAASAAPTGTALGGVVERLAPSSRAPPRSVLLAEPLHDPGVPAATRGGGSAASGSRLGGRPFALAVLPGYHNTKYINKNTIPSTY